MTTAGVRELFPGCEVLDEGWFGPLSETVEWLLRAAGLPGRTSPARLGADRRPWWEARPARRPRLTAGCGVGRVPVQTPSLMPSSSGGRDRLRVALYSGSSSATTCHLGLGWAASSTCSGAGGRTGCPSRQRQLRAVDGPRPPGRRRGGDRSGRDDAPSLRDRRPPHVRVRHLPRCSISPSWSRARPGGWPCTATSPRSTSSRSRQPAARSNGPSGRSPTST